MAIYLNNTTIKRGNSGIPIIYEEENLPEQTKTAIPSLEQQIINPDTGKMLSEVVIEPITSTLLTTLDEDFNAKNIIQGVEIFGLVGEKIELIVKDINFYDYDGTLLFSYSLEELQELTELPPLPVQPGLICQGWNFTLQELKEYNRPADVGAIYITDDGKTRIYINLEEGRLSPFLNLAINGTVVINWGDNTSTETLTGTSLEVLISSNVHNYTNSGNYIITLEVISGEFGFYYNSEQTMSYLLRYSLENNNINNGYLSAIQKIEIGAGITKLKTHSFSKCYSLKTITIPNTINEIGDFIFYECYNLKHINIPISFSSLPYSFLGAAYSLQAISIPPTITTIGGYAFYNCYALEKLAIPNSVNTISDFSFYQCFSLTTLYLPDSITILPASSLRGCYSLRIIKIPNNLTSIGNYAFQGCFSITKINLPGTLTNIGTNAFNNCFSVAFYKIEATTPPTLTNTGVFNNMAADCKIIVPNGTKNTYIAATNWSNFSNYIQEDTV